MMGSIESPCYDSYLRVRGFLGAFIKEERSLVSKPQVDKNKIYELSCFYRILLCSNRPWYTVALPTGALINVRQPVGLGMGTQGDMTNGLQYVSNA